MTSPYFKEKIAGLNIIFIAVLIYVGVLSLTLWIKIVILSVLIIFLVFSCFLLWFFQHLQNQKIDYLSAKGENILIVAPHQDDCVPIAGGFAIQTVEMGGHVYVLYTTDGFKDDKITRKQEAINAWSVLSKSSVTLDFLKYHNNLSFLTVEDINKGIDEIGEYIKKCDPDIIFIPLYEGGHYQHDVTNYMVSKALRKNRLDITVYEASIYNFYLSFKTTPQKVLSGLVRFIPFIRYDYPPEPVLEDQVFYLKMTDSQLQKKKMMIAEFKSQNPNKLIERWGFCDRYQKLHNYDYTQPPFDYYRSIASKAHGMKSLPVIGGIIRKGMIWTCTIHPDPDYRITKIPMEL